MGLLLTIPEYKDVDRLYFIDLLQKAEIREKEAADRIREKEAADRIERAAKRKEK
jgi:hypothetical protein